MERAKILGVQVQLVTMEETLQWIEAAIKTRVPRHIITGNPEMLMTAQKDEKFFQVMNTVDLVVPDGIGLVMAARRFMKLNVPERVTGFDVSTRFFSVAQKKGYSIYLLGSQPGVAETAKAQLEARFPGLKIIGTHHGFLNEQNKPQLIADIKAKKPDVLLVGMGAPRQEFFIADYKNEYQVPVSIGIGGCIDIWAGVKKRAPKVMQNLHLEWFYRLIKEPTRFLRMMVLPQFVFYAARYKERRIR